MGVLGCIIRFGRRHTRPLAGGVAAAIVVVGLRLALPWPLKAIVQTWVDNPGGDAAMSWSSIAIFGGTFLAVAMGLGFADLVERLQFAKFAIGLVRDLRAEAFSAVRRSEASNAGTGEVVARLIGDTARIKTGIKGFLVHVASHTFLLVGITGMLLWLYPPMGLVFGVACLALLTITGIGAAVMYRRAARYRHKEGRLAEHIFETISGDADSDAFDDINNDSSSAEASLTQMQGRATWAAHALFGLATLSAVVVGVHGVSTSAIEPSVLIAIVMYAMMLRGPMVQLVRQGTRTGKIVASLERVAALLDNVPDSIKSEPLTLRDRITIEQLKLRSRKTLGYKRAIRIDELEIVAGSRVAIVGGPGSGKTTLLRLMSGLETPERGSILLDGHPVVAIDHASFAGAEPSWPRRRLCEVIGVEPDSQQEETALRLLELLGARQLVRSLRSGLKTKVGSVELSLVERKAIACVRGAMSKAPLVLFDDLATDLKRGTATKRIRVILDACAGRTVLATFRRQPPAGLFDRVIVLRKGKVVADSAAAPLAEDSLENVYEVEI